MGLVPFCILLLPAIRRWRIRLLLLPPLATATVCILYSGSRTAYVAFIVFLLFWWSQSARKLRWIIVAAVVGIAAVPLLPDQYVGRFESITGQEAEGQSKEARVQILKDAWAILLTHPTGVGVASFPRVRIETFGRSQDTHNLYLEVATNLGVQGLAIFLFLVYAIIRSLRRSRDRFRRQILQLALLARSRDLPAPLRRRLRDHLRELNLLAAVCTAAYGFIVVRLALGLFGMDLYEVYWWFVAGLAISLSDIAIRSRRAGEMFAALCREHSEAQ